MSINLEHPNFCQCLDCRRRRHIRQLQRELIEESQRGEDLTDYICVNCDRAYRESMKMLVATIGQRDELGKLAKEKDDALSGWMEKVSNLTQQLFTARAELTPTGATNKARGSMSNDEKTDAMLANRFGPKVRPIAYVCHLPRIAALAREYGYAITVHGSLQKDLDLVAIPWSKVAVSGEEIVQAIAEMVGGFMLDGERAMEKPHGRKAWIIHLGAGLYIDLSVMPRTETA